MIWSIADNFNLLKNQENIIIATRSSKISVYFYSIFIILGSNFLPNIANKLRKILIFVGKNSYLIYLSHTLIIRIIFEPFYNKNIDAFLLISCAIIVAIGLELSVLRWNHGKIVPIETRL